MPGRKVDVRWNGDRVRRRALKSWEQIAPLVGGLVRKSIMARIKIGKRSANPGDPIRSHPDKARAKIVRDRIIYKVDTQRRAIVIGPSAERLTPFFDLHEFGGTWRPTMRSKKTYLYPARPYVAPGFQKAMNRLRHIVPVQFARAFERG